jgi:hypothetical protein
MAGRLILMLARRSQRPGFIIPTNNEIDEAVSDLVQLLKSLCNYDEDGVLQDPLNADAEILDETDDTFPEEYEEHAELMDIVDVEASSDEMHGVAEPLIDTEIGA